ncbi:MAG TPA: hypothetical protein VGY66_32530 [Gemmataceae bacterium]|jgi:hypothetical protein|nr:hypothetical protein [Gemmataceae bacterium]
MAKKLEKIDSVDQNIAQVRRFLNQNVRLFSRSGSVQKSWRYYHGHRQGPFFRLAFRVERKQRSLYLGRSPRLAAEVHKVLEQLQAPRREQRALARQQVQVRVAFRLHKRVFDQELQKIGLFLKGNEIRGRRHSVDRQRYAKEVEVPNGLCG